jgi:hypothetical protein
MGMLEDSAVHHRDTEAQRGGRGNRDFTDFADGQTEAEATAMTQYVTEADAISRLARR